MRGCCAFVSSICCTSVISRWPPNECSERGSLWCSPRVLALAIPRTLPSQACSFRSLVRAILSTVLREWASVEYVDVRRAVIDPGSRGHVPRHGQSPERQPNFHGHAANHAFRASCHRFITRASSCLSLSLSAIAFVLAGSSEYRDYCVTRAT